VAHKAFAGSGLAILRALRLSFMRPAFCLVTIALGLASVSAQVEGSGVLGTRLARGGYSRQ